MFFLGSVVLNFFSAIPAGSVIVMDNAAYHSRIVEKSASSSTTKGNIAEWLQKEGIISDLRKREHYEIVKLHKLPQPKCDIDVRAAELGFTVIYNHITANINQRGIVLGCEIIHLTYNMFKISHGSVQHRHAGTVEQVRAAREAIHRRRLVKREAERHQCTGLDNQFVFR